VFYSQDCDDSVNVWFSKDLVGCSDCIGCINLRNKKYHIFNEPYTKKDYEKFFKELNFGSWSAVAEFRKKADAFFLTQPRKQFHGRKNQNVTGDYIYNSKNVHDSYLLGNGEDLRYCYLLKDGPARKSYDWSIFGDNGEWIYESVWVGLTASHNYFSSWNYGCHDIEYCFGGMSSRNLFGCVGIRNGEYCILNKQYSKEEYKSMVDRIRKQMMEVLYTDYAGRVYRYGEMLPGELSPWAYNESTATEFFPLTKEEALAKGFAWRDPDVREYQASTVVVPDHINDATDDILKGILKCGSCGKNYQIIKMELDFYRRFQIPIPRVCPLCRDRNRINQLNPMALYGRTCAKCGKEIQTSYAPERKEIVYCEQCYNAEIA
jgi:CxxC-x17-CxxC domain-containing protein